MKREELNDVARRLLAHAQAGTTDMADRAQPIDVSVYTAPEVFELEKDLGAAAEAP